MTPALEHVLLLTLAIAQVVALVLTSAIPPASSADVWLGEHAPRVHGLLIVVRGLLANGPQIAAGVRKIGTGQVSKLLNVQGPTTPNEQLEFALWRAQTRARVVDASDRLMAVGEAPLPDAVRARGIRFVNGEAENNPSGAALPTTPRDGSPSDPGA
jgi:hypothetical protein